MIPLADILARSIVRRAISNGEDPARYPRLSKFVLGAVSIEAAEAAGAEPAVVYRLLRKHAAAAASRAWREQNDPERLAAVRAERDDLFMHALRSLGIEKGEIAVTHAQLHLKTGIPAGSMAPIVARLVAAGVVVVGKRKQPKGRDINTYRLPDAVEKVSAGPSTQESPADRLYAALCARCDAEGLVLADRPTLCDVSGTAYGSYEYHLWALRRTDRLQIVQRGQGIKTVFRMLRDGNPVGGSAPPVSTEKTVTRNKAVKVEPQPQEAPQEPDPEPKAGTSPAPTQEPPAAPPAPRKARPLPVVAIDPDEPLTCATPNSLLALGSRTCKWPLNDPPIGRADLTTFCCAETEVGHSYCTAHSIRAGQTGKPRTPLTADQEAAIRAAQGRAANRASLRRAMEALH